MTFDIQAHVGAIEATLLNLDSRAADILPAGLETYNENTRAFREQLLQALARARKALDPPGGSRVN
jgi:hypothetical protein